MKDYNCVIDCDVARLNAPLRPLFAAKGFAHRALLRRVPSDAIEVSVRVEGKTFPAKLLPDGTWSVDFPMDAFPEDYEGFYSIEGKGENELKYFIGRGRLCVEAI